MFSKIIITIFLILNVYVCWRTHVQLQHAITFYENRRALILLPAILFLILTVMVFTGTFLPAGRLKYICQCASNIWLGFLIFFGFLLLLTNIGLLFTGRSTGYRGSIHLGLLAAAALLIMIYGCWNAQQVSIRQWKLTWADGRFDVMESGRPVYDVEKIREPSDDAGNYRIVLLGDLHMSVNSVAETIADMAEKVNALEPDVILIAGDFFTSQAGGIPQPQAFIDALSGMQAREGVYGVWGNHDVEEPLLCGFAMSAKENAYRSQEMTDFIAKCGITILEDEMISLDQGRLQLIGRIDGEKPGNGLEERLSPADLKEKLSPDPQKPLLVLEHEPVEYQALDQIGSKLVLSGHTHNGQIFPGNLIIRFFNENSYGFKKVGSALTFVTSGIGYYGPPIRIGTHSEIAVLDLEKNW